MSKQTDRPNLLVIFTDQFRCDFYGAAGADFARTPNLDRIADRGMLLTHCCTNSPLCVPARVALATGLQSTRMGTLTNRCYLPGDRTTYYQRLREADYRVGCCGKVDLAKPTHWNSTGDRPCMFSYGFTHPVEIEGKMHAGNFPTPRGLYGMYLQQLGLYEAFHADYRRRQQTDWVADAFQDSILPTEAFQDLYIGRRAAEWIDAIGDDFPWHLMVSFAGPHDPFDPPTVYADHFRDAAMPEAICGGADGKPAWVRRRDRNLSREDVRSTRRQYCASIEAIDDAVGEVLAALERRGASENTYIVFGADHGEMLGDHGIYTKHVMYEGALRVPLAVCGPDIAPGQTSNELIELIDLNATLCELAGLAPQENVDALSFAGLLFGREHAGRGEIVSALSNCRCIRTERWKLIDNDNDVTELYDLAADPHERHNVAAEHTDLVQQLRARMLDRLITDAWRR